MSKVKFVPRTCKPEPGNKYYTRKASGGYSTAVAGKPTDECDVLANCVGYSYGRFNEVGGYGYCKYLAPVNPPAFPEYAEGCDTGIEPRLGAVIVWVNGARTGHLANVEAIIDENTIVTSESHYGGSSFDINIRQKKDGVFFFKEGYEFKCFIYNPDIEPRTEDYDVLNNKYIRLLADFETLRNAYVDARERNAELRSKLVETEATLSESQSSLDAKVKEVSTNLTALISAYGELNTQYQSITEEYNTARKECDKLTKENERLDKEYSALKLDYDSFTANINSMKGDINNDGKIDFKDVFRLFQYCINPDKHPIK